MQARNNHNEQMWMDLSQEAAWAGDRYWDAVNRGDPQSEIDELLREKERLEAERDKYYD
jgi:hypothetical protein